MKKTLVVSSVIGLGILGVIIHSYFFPEIPNWTTTTIETGDVRETVAVSGFIEAKDQADLSFPVSGTVTAVLAKEGDVVEAGDILATLGSSELVAERTEALSTLSKAEAAYQALEAGPRSELLDVSRAAVANAEANLTRTTAEENQKVENARAALLSTGLTAETNDENENSPAPTVSGTYSCTEEGVYTIDIYSSGSVSGMSYRTSGLEDTSGVVSTDQPASLGECGLYLQFTEDESYSGSTWTITIPNTRSSSYVSLKNAYDLAKTSANSAITAAGDALSLAKKESILNTAPARSEELTQALASVNAARARLDAIDARLLDRSIVSPFKGVVTDVSVTVGEVVTNNSVISVLAEDAFTLTARIPEIDITKLALGQKVEAVFDAKDDTTLSGQISYISPIATQIDGVAYFKTTIDLETTPDWIRAGLNADVDIIIKEQTGVLRLPKRFLLNTKSGQAVLIPTGAKTATTSITVDFIGNDSYVAVSGLPLGTTVVAP